MIASIFPVTYEKVINSEGRFGNSKGRSASDICKVRSGGLLLTDDSKLNQYFLMPTGQSFLAQDSLFC